MTRFYSKATNGFYDSALGGTIPLDAVLIEDDEYKALLASQASGGSITSDKDGNPVVIPSTVSSERKIVLKQIQILEGNISARRRDEAILGIDNGWLAEKRQAIAALRATLPPV